MPGNWRQGFRMRPETRARVRGEGQLRKPVWSLLQKQSYSSWPERPEPALDPQAMFTVHHQEAVTS